MKAITLIQPMGWAIVHGHKRFENRSRNILPLAMRGVRTQVAIHNGAKWDDGYGVFVHHNTRITPPQTPSAVIGVVTFTGRVFTDLDRPSASTRGRAWFWGPWGFELADPIAFDKPIACPGAQGFWNLREDIERYVMAQIARAA